jgi:flagellar biosynthesis GTPase FlhF
MISKSSGTIADGARAIGVATINANSYIARRLSLQRVTPHLFRYRQLPSLTFQGSNRAAIRHILSTMLKQTAKPVIIIGGFSGFGYMVDDVIKACSNEDDETIKITDEEMADVLTSEVFTHQAEKEVNNKDDTNTEEKMENERQEKIENERQEIKVDKNDILIRNEQMEDEKRKISMESEYKNEQEHQYQNQPQPANNKDENNTENFSMENEQEHQYQYQPQQQEQQPQQQSQQQLQQQQQNLQEEKKEKIEELKSGSLSLPEEQILIGLIIIFGAVVITILISLSCYKIFVKCLKNPSLGII